MGHPATVLTKATTIAFHLPEAVVTAFGSATIVTTVTVSETLTADSKSAKATVSPTRNANTLNTAGRTMRRTPFLERNPSAHRQMMTAVGRFTTAVLSSPRRTSATIT